jgi:hypothetical protein
MHNTEYAFCGSGYYRQIRGLSYTQFKQSREINEKSRRYVPRDSQF